MRVVFLAHSFPRHVGDVAGAFLLELARALREVAVEVRVVAPHAPGLAAADVLDGIPVRRYRYAPARHETLAYTGAMVETVRASVGGKLALAGLLAAGVAAARDEVRASNAALLHAHWWFPGGVSAAPAARLSGVPWLLTMHGSDVRLARGSGAARAAYRGVVRGAAIRTAVSEYLAATARGMAPELAVELAPMPVDVDRFVPAPHEGRSDPARLLFVGRLTRQKGVDRALRALGRLPDAVALDVVGDGPERGALAALADELGVASRVRWHGTQPSAVLPTFYRRATALVVPSHEEGLGLVAVEAQLCGTPVVAFASGGLIDVLDAGRAGVLVPPDDVAALAAALAALLAEPERARRVAQVARERALARHAPTAVARRYRALYERALAPVRIPAHA